MPPRLSSPPPLRLRDSTPPVEVRAITGLAAFFDLSGVDLALLENDWNSRVHINHILSLINDPDVRVSLQATKELRAYLMDVAKLNGLLNPETTTLRQTTTGGTVVQETRQLNSFQRLLAQETSDARRALSAPPSARVLLPDPKLTPVPT